MAEEKVVTTPTETTENVATTETVVTETKEETTNQEVVKDDEDNDNVEFSGEDSDVEETETKDVEKKKNNRNDSRYYAKLRREGKNEGIKEALNGENPYTHEKMETDEDIETYQVMKEMDQKGLDPLSSNDYIKFMQEKQKAELEAKKAEEAKTSAELAKQKESQDTINKYLEDFKGKYQDVDILNLMKEDSDLNELVLSNVAQGKDIVSAYELYNRLLNRNTLKDAERIATRRVQASLASVGSQTDGEDNTQAGVDINKLTDEEFDEYWARKHKR